MSVTAGLLVLSLMNTAQPQARVSAAAAVAQVAANPKAEGGKTSPPEAPHQFGLGGSMGFGSHGGGAAFRYFMSDRAGLNVNVGYYRPATSAPSTFIAAPSFIWMFKSHPDRDLDLRPYLGGGLNYASGGARVQTAGAPSGLYSRQGGLGGQVFGGVEATFKDAKAVAISAEVIHYEVASPGLGTSVRDGTTFSLLFHFYVN